MTMIARVGAAVVFIFVAASISTSAIAQSDPRCADPAAHCGALLAPACLQRAGAGSLAAGAPPPLPGQAAACEAQMQSYVACLSEIAAACDVGHGDDGDHAVALPPEVLAILEDPGAGLFGGAPKMTVMMVGACAMQAARDFSCGGAAANAQLLLSSFSPGADMFRGMTFELYGVEGRRTQRLADATAQILPVATGNMPLSVALPEAPRFLGACMTFERDGRRLGATQLWALQPGPGPKSPGFVGYQALEVAPSTPFDPATTGCDAALAELAASRGL